MAELSTMVASNLAQANMVQANRSVLVLHGPNLNMLGTREPQHYGSDTLQSINEQLLKQANQAGLTLETFQSNAEAEIIDKLHASVDKNIAFIIFNPAAYTHTSVAIRDAISAIKIPFIEVHLSNIHARETFRHHSYFSDIAVGVISGLGAYGYTLALEYITQKLRA
jgi:3-dehydroquinate dehydratase-2